MYGPPVRIWSGPWCKAHVLEVVFIQVQSITDTIERDSSRVKTVLYHFIGQMLLNLQINNKLMYSTKMFRPLYKQHKVHRLESL